MKLHSGANGASQESQGKTKFPCEVRKWKWAMLSLGPLSPRRTAREFMEHSSSLGHKVLDMKTCSKAKPKSLTSESKLGH